MKAFIIGLIAVIIIGGGYLVLQSNKDSSSGKPTSSATSQQAPASQSGSDSAKKAAATITYDGSSFSPASLTVKTGDTIEINNTSSTDVQFDSNPHPAHTDDSDLNVGIVAAGQNVTFTVTQKGTFGYHNHLDSSQGGSITVQ